MSIWPVEAAKFVVLDRGEILAPQKAPETIAPAVSPGLICKVAPIPMKAMPIVETLVNELPQAIATRVQTRKTVGKKNLTEIN